MPLPHPILRRQLLRRGLVLWGLARLMLLAVVAFAALLAEGTGHAALTSLRGIVSVPQVVPFVALLIWVDLHRRHELVLLGNLAQPRWAVVLLACVPGISCELAVLLALGVAPI